jgi:hypothetical protein
MGPQESTEPVFGKPRVGQASSVAPAGLLKLSEDGEDVQDHGPPSFLELPSRAVTPEGTHRLQLSDHELPERGGSGSCRIEAAEFGHVSFWQGLSDDSAEPTNGLRQTRVAAPTVRVALSSNWL